MELLYGQLLDPRDSLFADKDVLPEDKTHLGAPPRNYKSFQERFDAMVAAEPDATPERLEQLAIRARKDQRQAVMFFDFTYSADKTSSILHASLQAAAVRAENDGDAHAAAGYRRMAEAVEDAVRAGAAAALEYLQDEAGYSRAGYTAPCRRTRTAGHWPGRRPGGGSMPIGGSWPASCSTPAVTATLSCTCTTPS